MRIVIDTERGECLTSDDQGDRRLDLYGKAAFEILSRLWMKTSWNQKYSYTFTWLGRPIIQHPEDMFRLQEVIYTVRPDVIIETGVAHGGSLVFYAGLFRAMDHGRLVIGVDIYIRPQNRKAIETHELASMITLVEGDSVNEKVVAQVRAAIQQNEKVLVILDSAHSKAHVAAELDAYHQFVTPGSYIVATDGIMREVFDTPRGKAEWVTDNPAAAAEEFARRHKDFQLNSPRWRFNESSLEKNITAWPSAWLQRLA